MYQSPTLPHAHCSTDGHFYTWCIKACFKFTSGQRWTYLWPDGVKKSDPAACTVGQRRTSFWPGQSKPDSAACTIGKIGHILDLMFQSPTILHAQWAKSGHFCDLLNQSPTFLNSQKTKDGHNFDLILHSWPMMDTILMLKPNPDCMPQIVQTFLYKNILCPKKW